MNLVTLIWAWVAPFCALTSVVLAVMHGNWSAAAWATIAGLYALGVACRASGRP